MVNSLIPTQRIADLILLIRGKKVMLDADLAKIYGVTTGALNQAVKRNQERFPDAFMFALTAEEKTEVITVCDHLHFIKFSPVLPKAFSEHGGWGHHRQVPGPVMDLLDLAFRGGSLYGSAGSLESPHPTGSRIHIQSQG